MDAQSPPIADFGGIESGETLHFAHANGYPPGVYRAFLTALGDRYRVLASPKRPLWDRRAKPLLFRDWRVFADDLVAALDAVQGRHAGPVIGVGHSMGAVVTLLAANRRPDLFASLVLIEPAFLARRYQWLLNWSPAPLKRRIPLIDRTLRRRDHWFSQRHAFEWFRGKRVFAGVDDAVLHDYVMHGTVDDTDGAGRRLAYDKYWEAQCYVTIPDHVAELRRCSLPVLGVRGAGSNTLTPQVWRHWQRLAPGHDFVEVADAGHLLPLEKPAQTAALIADRMASASR